MWAVGLDGAEGFTVHDVRDLPNSRKVWEFKAPPGIHMHKLRYVHENLHYVNSERLPGERGANAQGGFYIFDISIPHAPRQVGVVSMPGSGSHRFGVDNTRHLAFLPSDAPGWDKRVIWTMDISEPLKPEVISIWGSPLAEIRGRRVGQRSRSRIGHLHAAARR